MLNPKTIALIGATEAPNSVGRTLMENLISSGRTVYPINLKRSSVLGIGALAVDLFHAYFWRAGIGAAFSRRKP